MLTLGFCAAGAQVIAQSNLTIESVLRAVQERKLMLAVKATVLDELRKDGTSQPTDTVEAGDLIAWPDGILPFPANHSISTLRSALLALNKALAEYYMLEPAYLAIPAGQTKILKDLWQYNCRQRPVLDKFTEDNWRVNLREFAARIEQCQVLPWPVLGCYAEGNCAKAGPLSGSPLLSPARCIGGAPEPVSSCSLGIYSWVHTEGLFTPWHWSVSSGDISYSIGQGTVESGGAVNSKLGFMSGLKTRLSPTTPLPSGASNLTGSVEFFRGGGGDRLSQFHSSGFPELDEGLSKIYPDAWSLTQLSKLNATLHGSGGEIILGEFYTEYVSADFHTEFTNVMTWLELPLDSISSSWETVAIGGNNVARLKLSVNLDSISVADSEIVWRGSENKFYENASVSLACIHRPNFTPLLPPVVKNMEGSVIPPGTVSLLAEDRDPVRIHLGRGGDNRLVGGFLSTRLSPYFDFDGFGSLLFTGSHTAFDVVYEADKAEFEDPVVLPGGGDPRSYHYSASQEFSQIQQDQSGFSSRLEYMREWHGPRLRQVKGGDVIADIAYLTGYKKEVKLYWVSQVGNKDPVSGLYWITGAPFKRVTIENPNANGNQLATLINTLKITENDILQHEVKYELDHVHSELMNLDVYTDSWTVASTSLSGTANYIQTRALEVTSILDGYFWKDVSRKETMVENGVTWTSRKTFKEDLAPTFTDFPILLHSEVEEDGETRRVDLEWNELPNSAPFLTYGILWNPTRVTYSGTDAWELNGTELTFDPAHYAMPNTETRMVMGNRQTATHTWPLEQHRTIWTLNGAEYARRTLAYSNALRTMTAVQGGLSTVYTYGESNGPMPWVLKTVEGPGGWRQDFDYTFGLVETVSELLSGWGAGHLGGTCSKSKVNRFGGLIESDSKTIDGVVLSKAKGTEHTAWGVPKEVEHLRGKETASFNTNSPATYGTLASAKDLFGNVMQVPSYDALKRPTSIDTGFETLVPSYGSPLVSSVTSSAGHTISSVISGFGDLQTASTTEGNGAAVDLTEEAPSLTVDGRSVPLKLNEAGEVEGVGSGLGARGSEVSWDVVDGQLRQTVMNLTQTDAAHHAVKTYYDEAGRLVKQERMGANGAVATETWAYPDARTVVHTPGPGPVIQAVTRTLSTDGMTLTTKVGTRDLKRVRRENQGGKLVLITEKYDDSGGLGDVWQAVGTETIDPTLGTTTFTPWDLTAEAVGQSVTPPAAAGSQTQIDLAAGTDTSHVTLTAGVPTAVTGTVDGVGFDLDAFTYDHGRLRGASGVLAGKNAGFELDEAGRIKRLWGSGFDKRYTYGGASGYSVTVNDTTQGTTQTFSVSATGDFTGISGDGVQAVSASTQDLAGGKKETTYAGWLSRRTAADGAVLVKDYGALTETTDYTAEGLPDGVGTGPARLTISYGDRTRSVSGSGVSYEEQFYHAGPRKSVSGSGEARSFTYLRGALASETHTAGPWSGVEMEYGQDSRGRLGTVSATGGYAVTYGYDGGSSRLGSVTSGNVGASYGYDPTTKQRDAMQRGTLTTSWSRDGVGREEGQVTGAFGYGFTYDERHRRITRTGTGAAASGVGWSNLTYDDQDRLRSAQLSNGTTLNYTYDTRGNRLSGGGAATTYTVNGLNQATARNTGSAGMGYGVYGTVKPGARVRVFHPGAPSGEELVVNAVTGAYQGWWPAGAGGVTRVELMVRGTLTGAGVQGTDAVSEKVVWAVIPAAVESYVYDGAGRMTEDGTWVYGWDGAGRLISLARKAGTALDPEVSAESMGYTYDADGRRTGRSHVVTKTGGVTTVEYSKVLWDGWLPVGEERTVNGVAQARRWFVWGMDLSGSLGGAGGIGGLVSIREEGGRTLLPVDDGLGNITAVVNAATGQVVARYDYGPYGEMVGESGEVGACPFRYQSKWWDGEAGLSYFGYRHYSPRMGRWLSRDPLGEAGGFNLYAYCEGDPVNNWDYLGLDPYPIQDPRMYQAILINEGMKALMTSGTTPLFDQIGKEMADVNQQVASGQMGVWEGMGNRVMGKVAQVGLGTVLFPWVYRDAAEEFGTYNPGEIILRRGIYEGVIVNGSKNVYGMLTQRDFASSMNSLDSGVDALLFWRGGKMALSRGGAAPSTSGAFRFYEQGGGSHSRSSSWAGRQRFDPSNLTAEQLDAAIMKSIRRKSGATGNAAGQIVASADQMEFILNGATYWRRNVLAQNPRYAHSSSYGKGTVIHSHVSKQIQRLNIADLIINERLYGTSQFISPSTGLPYTYRIPDYRLPSTIFDIKPVGTPLGGPQVIDFMNFANTPDVRFIFYQSW